MNDNNKAEIDVINHLLQVEKDSALMIDEALQESEKRVSKARSDYNALFKTKYDEGVAALEKKFQQDSENAVKKHQSVIDEYKNGLENKKQNVTAFNKVLDSLLFSKN